MATEVIRQHIYEILQREVKDPRVRSLTILGVDLSLDLKNCTVRVCKFAQLDPAAASSEETQDLMEGLKSASHFVYEALKKRLRMKVIPRIRFEYDASLETSAHVFELLNQVRQEEQA